MPSKPKPITMDAVYTAPGYLFRRMQQIAVAIFVEECRAFDLTPVQYAALVAISTHPGIDATRLSAVIAFDRSTLGNVIERLETKSLIERKPGREDKRVKLLYLTKSGAALLRDIVATVEKAQARIGRDIDTEAPCIGKLRHQTEIGDGRPVAEAERAGLISDQGLAGR